MNSVFTIPLGQTARATVTYVVLLSTELAGKIYRPTSSDFESYNSANRQSYAIPVTEIASTGVYQFELPAPLRVDGRLYIVLVFQRPTPASSPADGDTLIQTGSIDVRNQTAQMLGVEVRAD